MPLNCNTKYCMNQLLIVFIHGFRGRGEGTFEEFPSRIETNLSNVLPSFSIKCIVYPRYETRGNLQDAVYSFTKWLCQAANKARAIVLCGHSMGGLLGADVTIYIRSKAFKSDNPNIDPPNVIGLLAYDTPYFGLHETLIHRTASKAFSSVTETATALTTVIPVASYLTRSNSEPVKSEKENKEASGWGWWAAGAIALVGAGVAAAYTYSNEISEGIDWASGHLEFVSALYREKECRERIESIVESGLLFHCFYTQLKESERTFIQAPPPKFKTYFSKVISVASDEIAAHTGMFSPQYDASYYLLGQESVKLIQQAIRKQAR